MAPRTIEELPAAKREAVHGLLLGARPEDLAWAGSKSPERVLALSREALEDLDPDLAEPLSPEDRRRVADYMLGQQSPGQAAGTWEILEASADARRWAVWIRESLAGHYRGDPPAIPGVDDASSPSRRARRGRPPPQGRLERRRRERARKREIAALQAAAAELSSPFRPEALAALREGKDSIKLPHFASRPVRVALYGLLSLLLVGFALAVTISVPTYTSSTVIVVPVPEGAGGTVRGLGMVALFPTSVAGDLEEGQSLRVQLPDTTERVSTRIDYVSDRVMSPRQIIERFKLAQANANRVLGPAAVAVAPLRLPDKAPPRRTFAGAVTPDADARTGSRRVISLVKP